MTEKQFSKLVVKELEEQYSVFLVKVEGLRRGLPDLIFSYKGIFVGLELKNGSSYKLQPHQAENLRKIRASGGKGYCLICSDTWKEELNSMLNTDYVQELEIEDWD